MDNISTEEKFHSAVELIKNLPKAGSVSPSNETKLKFYSYYKQATEGPCELSKPSFWDIINRAKWDAWNRLGDMTKEEAMQRYVHEFVKIIEATPMDNLDDPSMVEDYVQLMGPYIAYAPKEFREKHINGKPPFNNNAGDYVSSNSMNSRDSSQDAAAVLPAYNGNRELNGGGNESDCDEFSDTLERVDEAETGEETLKGSNIVSMRGGGKAGKSDKNSPAGNQGRSNIPSQNPLHAVGPSISSLPGSSRDRLGGAGGNGRRNEGECQPSLPSDVGEQLAVAVLRLQHTMEQVVTRLDSLEALLTSRQQEMLPKRPRNWRLFGIHPAGALLIFSWPFIVQWIIFVIRKRQRKGL